VFVSGRAAKTRRVARGAALLAKSASEDWFASLDDPLVERA
jgi:hypothetical protein